MRAKPQCMQTPVREVRASSKVAAVSSTGQLGEICLVVADSRMLLTACDDMHAHLYDVEHASLIEAFSGMSRHLSPALVNNCFQG